MEGVVGELKPNVSRLFRVNLIKILVFFVVVMGFIFYLKYMGIIDELTTTLSSFGVTINTRLTLIFIMFITLLIAFFVVVFNYLALGKVRYVFYNDRMVCYQNFMIAQVTETTIPYDNIVSVNFKRKGIGTGAVEIGLTAMKKEKIVLEYIDNPEKAVRTMLNILNQHRSKKYAEFTENYKREKILDRF